MRPRTILSSLLLVPTLLAAQSPPSRTVTNNRLNSSADPRAAFTVDTAFRFMGGQTIDILKVAGAEQYFFLQLAPDKAVQRFYWLQFEHFYSTNEYKYDYSEIATQELALGPLSFIGDIRTIPKYFTDDDRPGSDSEAAVTFLRKKGVSLEGTFVTLRLFHFPDTTKRRELMIIYGERLLDEASSDQVGSTLVAHARAGLAVQ